MRSKRGINIINSNSAVLYLLVILCVLLLSMILLTLGITPQVAYAESVGQGDDVREYIESEYNTNSELHYSADGMSYELDISGDDPIVKYIPRELFLTPNTTLEIYSDYGYFIHTFRDWSYMQDEALDNMHSYVLVFAIDYIAGRADFETKDRFSYTITPLFQREYFAVIPNGTDDYVTLGFFSYADIKLNATSWEGFLYAAYGSDYILHYNISSTVDMSHGVIASAPQRNDNVSYQCELFYDEINLFNLADITIAVNIFNGQDLNEGDSGYDVLDDEGNFIIRTGIDIEAIEYTGEYDFNAIAKDTGHFAAGKFVSMVIGWIPTVGAYINNAWDVAEFIRETESHYYDDQFEFVDYSSYYASTVYANSKHSQMELTGGKLCRSSAITTTAMDGVEAWLRVGDHFTGTFEVAGSTGNEPGWYTIAQHSIALSVKCLISDFPTVSGTSDFFANDFNELRGKPISEDAATEAYVRGNDGDIEGKDSFAFTAPRNGLYEVSLTNGTGVDYIITDVADTTVYEPISGGMYYFEEGQDYIIELTNTTSTLKRPTVKVSLAVIEADYGDSFTFTLPAGEDVVIGVDMLNEFTNASVNGTGAEIVAYIDNNGIAHTVNHNSIDLRASDVERLVIEVAGNSEQTVTLAFSDLPEIVADGETQVTVDGTINYFKFVPQAGNYFFIYTASEAIATTLHTEDGSQVAVDSGNDMYVVGLTVGETYWLMLNYTGHGEGTIGIETISFDGEYEWRLDDKLVAPSEDVFVYEGKTYAYSLLIDGEEYTVVLEKENDQYSGQVAVPDDPPGEITVSGYSELFDADHLPEVNLYYTIRRVDIGTGVTEVKVYLDLILFNPLAEIAADPELLYISETMSYEDYVDVTVTVGDEKIESFDYYVSYQSGLFIDREHSGTVSVYGNSPKFSFDCADLIVYAPKVMLTGFVYDGYYFYFPESRSPQETFSVIYGKGSGTEDDPYYINTYQHFLTYALDATSLSSEDEKIYWALGSDIDISQGTLSVNEFYGELDGKKHTISGLTIDIGTDPLAADTSFGWVEHNYGKICNVTFADVNVTGGVCHTGAWAFIGVVAGINEAGGVINNVSIENANISVDRNMARIGGLVGVNEGTISDCVIGDMWFGDPEVSMFSNADMGIICGENGGTVDGCKVHFVVINYYPSVANRSVGGIVGYCRAGTIRNCTVWLCKIVTIGTDAGICPNIGSVAGHVANSNMLVNNSAGCVFELDLLTDAQKVNCGGTDRQYGYEG